MSDKLCLSSFPEMRKLCHTEKEKKRKKKSCECSMASISSGWLGEDKTNIKKRQSKISPPPYCRPFYFQGSRATSYLLQRNHKFPK